MNRRSVALAGLVIAALAGSACPAFAEGNKTPATKAGSKSTRPTNAKAPSTSGAKPSTNANKKLAKTPKGQKAKPDSEDAKDAKPEAAAPEAPPPAPASEAKPVQPEETKPAPVEEAKPVVAEPAKVEEPKVFLHIESPSPVTIERDTGEAVCTSPCDQLVPAASLYRVGGQRPSKPFVLDAKNGNAKVSVDPATNREFYTGLGVLGGGGALAIAGGIVLGVANANKGPVPGNSGETTDTGFTDGMTAGAIMVVAGLAAGIWGGATALSNRESTVSGNVQKPPPVRGENTTLKAAGVFPETRPTFFMPVFGGTF